MKKFLLMTTVFATVFGANVQADVLTINKNTMLDESASYDSLNVLNPNYFYFLGGDSILSLTEKVDSTVAAGAYLVVGDKSEISLASGANLMVDGYFIAAGSPSLYTKEGEGDKIFFDEDKYKEAALPETTKISGNVNFSSNAQIGGVLSVLTASGEIANRVDYSSSEYMNLVANKTITEYETPALLSIGGNVNLAGALNFTDKSFLEVSGKINIAGVVYLTGAVNLKSNITVKDGTSATLSGVNAKITGNVDLEKNSYFSVVSNKESTVSLAGNVSNAGTFVIGSGSAKETLSIDKEKTFTNSGILKVYAGSVLDGTVSNSIGTTTGQIQGTGTIKDLHIKTSNEAAIVDASTIFTGEQTHVTNLHLENKAVLAGNTVFFESLQGNGTFQASANSNLTQKKLDLNGTILDLNGTQVASSEADFTLTVNNATLKNGTVDGKVIFQSGTNTLDNTFAYGGFVNEKESTLSILGTVATYVEGLTNKGKLDVQGNVNAPVYHSGGVITGTGTIAQLTIEENISALSSIVKDETYIPALSIAPGYSVTYDTAAKVKISQIIGGGKLVLQKDLFIEEPFFIVTNSSSLDLGTKILDLSGGIYFYDSSSLYISVNGATDGQFGQLKVNSLQTDGIPSKLNLMVKNNIWAKGDTKELPLIVSTNAFTDNFTLSESVRYKFERTATPGTYAITYLYSAADIAGFGGGNESVQEQAVVWDDVPLSGPSTTQGRVASALYYLSNTTGTEKEYVQALSTLAPSIKPVAQIQSVDTTVVAINTVSQRMSGRMGIGNAIQRGKRSQYNSRSGYRGRSGGNPELTEGIWAQGLYNKTKFDVSNGFESTTAGVAGGLDKRTQNGLVGFAFSVADLDTEENAGRKIDATLHTGMLYGEYRFNDFFINGILSGTYGAYKEHKNVYGVDVTADYGVYTAGGQITLGYDYKGFSPLLGGRYFYAYQEDYEDDAGQEISAEGLQTATVLGGFRYAPVLQAADKVFIIPEIKVLAAYDFVEPTENKSVINVGGASYNVVENEEDKLDRFGIEAATGITLDLGRLEASVRYEGTFKTDYESHTGMFELRYNFSY